ncbi:MAG: phosphotriesterase-related protein [Escherichia coli]
MSFDPTGYTLAHEHLHIDLSGFKNNVDCRLDQYAFICQEMNDLMTRGVRNVIEMTNRYMGRNAQFMLDVMRETGINVVACTGYYQDAFFPEHVATRSVQELAQEMVDEIEQGIDGTELKAGIIAEIGTSEGKITPLEEAIVAVALVTTRPDADLTHTSFNDGRATGVAATHGCLRVTVGHCDLKTTSTTFEDDRSRRVRAVRHHRQNSYYPDEKRIAMLHALRDRGLLNRVMLSMDITRRSHLKANGGYGYDYLLTTFIPQLRQSGFSQADVDVMLRENPSQFFQ